MDASSYLRPAQAAKRWPHDGKPPHPAKVIRCITRGVKSRQRDGRIRLRAIRDSQSWLTRPEWIEQFLDELTRDRTEAAVSPLASVRAERAMRALAAEGF